MCFDIKIFIGRCCSGIEGDVIIEIVKKDFHNNKKKLVKMTMGGAGMTIHDLGVNIEPKKFVEKNETIVCLSALLATTMPTMKKTIETIVEVGLREQIEILVDGAPVTQTFCEEIGADGYSPDAESADRLAKTFAM